jgi:glucokinase
MMNLGIDIGGTSVKALLADGCTVLRRARIGSKQGDALVANIAALINKFGVGSAGVCVPGSIDAARGVVIDAHNLGLHHYPLKSALERMCAARIAIANDAAAAALGEYTYGSLSKSRACAIVTLGTGIGVGVLFDGKIFHGGMLAGIEAGHIIIGGSEKCTCGNVGCAEAYLSATALKRRGEPETLLKDKDFAEAYCEKLSDYLASLTNAYGLDAIALGGGVSEGLNAYIDLIQLKTRQKSFFKGALAPKVRIAQLGNDAGALGATLLFTAIP